jgi:hypothetical protein
LITFLLKQQLEITIHIPKLPKNSFTCQGRHRQRSLFPGEQAKERLSNGLEREIKGHLLNIEAIRFRRKL